MAECWPRAGKTLTVPLVPLESGRKGVASLTVTEADLATAFGSGDVAVLATPRLVALTEEATMAAVAADLDPGSTTVGMRVHIDHLKPSALGANVEATALLERVDGRRLTFAVEVTGEGAVVAQGQVIRVLVDTERFLERLQPNEGT